jgi:hypothetical protein
MAEGPEMSRQFGRHRRIWEDDIKKLLKKEYGRAWAGFI